MFQIEVLHTYNVRWRKIFSTLGLAGEMGCSIGDCLFPKIFSPMGDRVEVLPSGSCRGCAKGYFSGGRLAIMPYNA